MRRARQFAVVLLALAGMSAAEVIDRIVATVNKQPILQSDWDDACRFEAFLDARSPAGMSAAEKQATLERLIDQTLLEQQLRGAAFARATDADVAQRIADVRRQHPAGKTEDEWRQALASYQFTEAEFATRIRAQIDALRFIDARLRPTVRLNEAEVERYYRDEFLPQLRRAGGTEQPLAQVRTRIEQLLTEQRVNAQIATWLESLRSAASIHMRDTPRTEAQDHGSGH